MVKVASIKNIIKDLTPRQKKAMRRHAVHHSLAHIRSMTRSLKKGSTFANAHSKAMKTTGK